MDKNKINELLYNKSETLHKRQNRIFLFIFIFPLIYFLLDNSFVSEVKTSLISIDQTEIILLSFPIIYAILLLIAIIQTNKVNDIKKEMDSMEAQSLVITKRILKLLSPISIIKEILTEAKAKGFLGIIVIYAPIITFILLFPFIFLGYTIYDNLNYEGEFETIAFWSAIFAFWTIIPIVVNLIAGLKKSNSN